MASEKIKLVVVDENTLGYIHPLQPETLCILHASILRGASTSASPTYLTGKTVRPATKQDFEDYRVCVKGFDNKEVYELAD